MSKITKSKFLRKFKDIKIPTTKHYEWTEYNGVKFPVLMSPGQIVNIKKAYERWKKQSNNKS